MFLKDHCVEEKVDAVLVSLDAKKAFDPVDHGYIQVGSFDSAYMLEMKESNLVCRANRLLLVKCYDDKKVKSPYNWVISLLTQPEVANQQQQQKTVIESYSTILGIFGTPSSVMPQYPEP